MVPLILALAPVHQLMTLTGHVASLPRVTVVFIIKKLAEHVTRTIQEDMSFEENSTPTEKSISYAVSYSIKLR